MHRRRGLMTIVIAAISIPLVFAIVGGAFAAKNVKLTANLSGANEIPPADPDGSGTAKVKLKKEKKEVCFDITFQKIQNPVAGHIHKGTADVNGPIKVLLFENAAGVSSPISDCVNARKKLIKKIAKHPKRWYVNLHTTATDFPDGAIRGQLGGSGGGGGGGGDGRPPGY
jgi:CHRD domain